MQENLHDKEAIKKLKSIAESTRVCMMLTQSEEPEESCRPMAVSAVDEDGTIWFFSRRQSSKIFEIQSDHNIQLIFSDPGKENFMNVTGNASVLEDRRKIDELWSAYLKAWFPEGKDDPSICLIRVTPAEAYYWDGGKGKMIAFIKMIASAVTGKQLAEGKEGSLDI